MDQALLASGIKTLFPSRQGYLGKMKEKEQENAVLKAMLLTAQRIKGIGGVLDLKDLRVKFKKGVRASCDTRPESERAIVTIDPLKYAQSIKTGIHEMTHPLEHFDPIVNDMVTALHSRRLGENVNDVHKYTEKEDIIQDHYADIYSGKLYAGDYDWTIGRDLAPSEAVTMCLQEILFDEDDALELLKKDPVHFAFGYALLKGYFHA